METILGRRAFYIQNTVAHHFAMPADRKGYWRCNCDEDMHLERCWVDHHITVQIIHALNVLDDKPSASDTLAKAWGLDKETR